MRYMWYQGRQLLISARKQEAISSTRGGIFVSVREYVKKCPSRRTIIQYSGQQYTKIPIPPFERGTCTTVFHTSGNLDECSFNNVQSGKSLLNSFSKITWKGICLRYRFFHWGNIFTIYIASITTTVTTRDDCCNCVEDCGEQIGAGYLLALESLKVIWTR